MIKGGYAGVWLTPGTLLAARDPHGIRPLCLGKIEWMSGGDPVLTGARRTAWVVASETCALDTVGAEFVRDIAPGEIVVIDEEGLQVIRSVMNDRPAYARSIRLFRSPR